MHFETLSLFTNSEIQTPFSQMPGSKYQSMKSLQTYHTLLGEASYCYKFHAISLLFHRLFQTSLKWILFLLSRKHTCISKGLVYLMYMNIAHCMVKFQLCMPSTLIVTLCSVRWGDYFILYFHVSLRRHPRDRLRMFSIKEQRETF